MNHGKSRVVRPLQFTLDTKLMQFLPKRNQSDIQNGCSLLNNESIGGM